MGGQTDLGNPRQPRQNRHTPAGTRIAKSVLDILRIQSMNRAGQFSEYLERNRAITHRKRGCPRLTIEAGGRCRGPVLRASSFTRSGGDGCCFSLLASGSLSIEAFGAFKSAPPSNSRVPLTRLTTPSSTERSRALLARGTRGTHLACTSPT